MTENNKKPKKSTGVEIAKGVAGTLFTIWAVNEARKGIPKIEEKWKREIEGVRLLVVGASGTGKTTFINWLENKYFDYDDLEHFESENNKFPKTSASGTTVNNFDTEISGKKYSLHFKKDLPGEINLDDSDQVSNVLNIWEQVAEVHRPKAIVIMLSEEPEDIEDPMRSEDTQRVTPIKNKVGLKRSIALIRSYVKAHPRHLKTVQVIVNKMDLWHPNFSYPNEKDYNHRLHAVLYNNFSHELDELRDLSAEYGFELIFSGIALRNLRRVAITVDEMLKSVISRM
ncbi:MAG: GTPase domain-containing protein [Chloroflexota bacterium]